MRILQINSVCGVKSTGRICTDLAEVLNNEGHECMVAYGREAVPKEYAGIAHLIGNPGDVRRHGLKARLFDACGFGSTRVTKNLIEWIKEYNPDLIHLHNLHGYYINVEELFSFLSEYGKPVVWTLHDCWAITGHCAYFMQVACQKWKTGCYDCPKKTSYPQSLVFDCSKKNWKKKKQLFNRMKNMTLVTPSEWLAGIIRQSYLNKYPVHAIPNGINLDLFKPTPGNFRERFGLEGKKIVLGAATAWSERKGLNEFIELSKILDDEYRVVLVGLTSEQIKEMPDTVLGLGLTNNVHELAEIYTAADVFLNAGKEETMGLTTVEAMACGTPVVVSNLTAVPEVVTEKGGIVLPDLKPETIAKGVRTVIDSEYNDTISNAKRYEKKAQYKKYIQLYLNCLQKLDTGENNEDS